MIDIEIFEKCLGSKSFFCPKDLLKMGLFGSKSQINECIRSKKIPSVYVTDRRRVIMRQDLIEFILEIQS